VVGVECALGHGRNGWDHQALGVVMVYVPVASLEVSCDQAWYTLLQRAHSVANAMLAVRPREGASISP
jgi:hypothetical protein